MNNISYTDLAPPIRALVDELIAEVECILDESDAARDLMDALDDLLPDTLAAIDAVTLLMRDWLIEAGNQIEG